MESGLILTKPVSPGQNSTSNVFKHLQTETSQTSSAQRSRAPPPLTSN